MRALSVFGKFVVLLGMLNAAACGRSEPAAGGAGSDTSKEAAAKETYPEPRWPAYFKPAKTADDLMPAARNLARNRSGLQGNGMGILKEGESVLIVVNNDDADPMVLEAVGRALKERKVIPHIKFRSELLGKSKEQVAREQGDEGAGRRIEDAGIYQASAWVDGQFPNPAEPKAWLKKRRPDLYAELFPGDKSPVGAGPGMAEGGGGGAAAAGQGEQYRNRNAVGEAIKKYLTTHPEIRGVFWGGGGSTGLRRQLYPMSDKFLGLFVQDNIYSLQSPMSSYPGDVWQLAEEQLLEPLVYVDRVEAKDPEGIDVWADLTEEMSQKWAQGAYQRGHLYMFPNQATGRFGYSFVDYPAFQPKYLPREPIARINGTIAGTQGHGGFYPRWEVTFKDGFITGVKGGGAQGEALREFLQYPGLNERTYPFHNQPGYWYLYEIAFGSHPKGFRNPVDLLDSGSTSPERVRSGVIHWGLGIRVWHDPSGPSESKVWADYTEKNNVPKDHGWHTHTYFTTYRVRLRNANKWVNLIEKGHMTSLDHPEVRALASRYGDPDYLLTEDWVPEVPGINAPGDYLKDYAANPGAYSLKVLEKAQNGSYTHYFPKPAGKQ